jgi:hypothetical protein
MWLDGKGWAKSILFSTVCQLFSFQKENNLAGASANPSVFF